HVDVVGEVLPDPAYTFDLCLASQLAFGAYLAGHTGDLVSEPVQLVDHHVDGFFQLQDLAPDVDGDLLAEVAVCYSCRDLGDVADLAGQVPGHDVDVVGEVFPDAADALDVGLTAELAFGADFAGDARHLGGEAVQLLDHRVDRLRGAQELPLQRLALDVEWHSPRQVAVGDGPDDARHLARRADQIFDEAVDGIDGRLPAAPHRTDRSSLIDPSFLAHHPAHALQLFAHPLVGFDDFVECVGDLPVQAC